jgi:hypothetical protein
MPVGAENRWVLADFGRNKGEASFREARDINFHVQLVTGGEFRNDATGGDVQIVEVTQYSGEDARVTVGGDPEAHKCGAGCGVAGGH